MAPCPTYIPCLGPLRHATDYLLGVLKSFRGRHYKNNILAAAVCGLYLPDRSRTLLLPTVWRDLDVGQNVRKNSEVQGEM